MRIYFIVAVLAVPALFYIADANNYKGFMKEDDLKKNEFADFDIFDENDDFETDIKVEEDFQETEKPASAPNVKYNNIHEEVVVEVQRGLNKF